MGVFSRHESLRGNRVVTETAPEFSSDWLRHANIPTLLMVLVHLTGESAWLDPPFRPSRTRGLEDNDSGGLSWDLQVQVREAAIRAIEQWRKDGQVAVPVPDDRMLARMLSVCMGEEVPPEYGQLIREELQPFLGRGTWWEQRLAAMSAGPRQRSLRVGVIGAGASGILAAAFLRRAGFTCVVFEREPGLGGTWRLNRYPGVAVDTPSQYYCYSFTQYEWSRYFATGPEVREYLENVAVNEGLRECIRFETRVIRAAYDEDRRIWELLVEGPEGIERQEFDAVVSAVGLFSKPNVPVKGVEEFEGAVFHAAEWPEGVNLDGKVVGVVGSGATAMQIVPELQRTARRVVVFQRSAQWVAPFDKRGRDISSEVQNLLRSVPLYAGWYRLRQFWTFTDRILPALRVDPKWDRSTHTVNAINDGYRRLFTRYLEAELGGRQDLIAKCTPKYPPFGKRILLDYGWYQALKQPNVELVNEAVRTLTGSGVRTESGRETAVEAVVLATGFNVSEFVNSYDVLGRRGDRLRDVWDGDNCRAYLGVMVPGFPNYFMLYGPNTQTAGGSLLMGIERQMAYVLAILTRMASEGVETVEVRREPFEKYNARIRRDHEGLVWSITDYSTYYRNAKGVVTVVTPDRAVDAFELLREPQWEDFCIVRRPGA